MDTVVGICRSVCPVEESMDLLAVLTTASQMIVAATVEPSFITNCQPTSFAMPKIQPSPPFCAREEIWHCWVWRDFGRVQEREWQFLVDPVRFSMPLSLQSLNT